MLRTARKERGDDIILQQPSLSSPLSVVRTCWFSRSGPSISWHAGKYRNFAGIIYASCASDCSGAHHSTIALGSFRSFPATEEFHSLWSSVLARIGSATFVSSFVGISTPLMRLLTCSMCSSSKVSTSLQFSSGASEIPPPARGWCENCRRASPNIRCAAATPINAPNTWAAIYTAASLQLVPP